MQSYQEAALTPLYCATSTDIEGISGRYFAACFQVTPSPAALDNDLGEKLWHESERVTGLSW